jgi:hypothetical protein
VHDDPPGGASARPSGTEGSAKAVKAQELAALLQGDTAVKSGEEWLSSLVQLATEGVLQETLEQEQAEVLGRSRSERRRAAPGYRNSYYVSPHPV